jgi:WD40 repeat protein
MIAWAMGDVDIWDAVAGQTLWAYQAYTLAGATDASWSPDGQRLAVAGDYQGQVLDRRTGALLARDDPGEAWFMEHVAWSPDGTLIALSGASQNDSAQVWDAATGVETVLGNAVIS